MILGPCENQASMIRVIFEFVPQNIYHIIRNDSGFQAFSYSQSFLTRSAYEMPGVVLLRCFVRWKKKERLFASYMYLPKSIAESSYIVPPSL